MPGIFDLLPLLDGWAYIAKTQASGRGQPSLVVAPGQQQPLVDEKGGSGWLLELQIALNTVYANVGLTVRHKGVAADFNGYLSVLDLLSAGLTKPVNTNFYLSEQSMIPSSGRTKVVSALLPVALGTGLVYPGYPVSVKALPGNIGAVYLAPVQVLALVPGSRTVLSPGDTTTLSDFTSLAHVWVAADNATDGVEFSQMVLDTVNADAVFSVNLLPPFPLPFNDGFLLQVDNPSTLPALAGGGPNSSKVTIASWNAIYVKIVNQEAFAKSYANFTAGRAPAMAGR